jgi:hypothetical protein
VIVLSIGIFRPGYKWCSIHIEPNNHDIHIGTSEGKTAEHEAAETYKCYSSHDELCDVCRMSHAVSLAQRIAIVTRFEPVSGNKNRIGLSIQQMSAYRTSQMSRNLFLISISCVVNSKM